MARGGSPYLCLPHLAGTYCLLLQAHPGRKTFATPKVARSAPRDQVKLATGHQTEASFNQYPGINEAELVAWYRKTARRAT